MILIGFYKKFEDNKIFILDFFSNMNNIFVDTQDFNDELFDVLCSIEEGQIIKIEYEKIDDIKRLNKLYFMK